MHLVHRLNNLQPGEIAEEFSGQFQGDILLTYKQLLSLRNGWITEKYRWLNQTVPIEFDDDVTDERRDFIWSAIEEIHKFSCVRFITRTTELDYIHVQVM